MTNTAGTYVNQKSDTPTGAVETWTASLPGVPGIDNLHSYAADQRRTQPEPVPAQGYIPSPGPWMNSRVSPQATQTEWDARDPREEEQREVLTVQTTNGAPQNPYPLAPINPATGARNTGRTPERATQYYGPPMYALQRQLFRTAQLQPQFTGEHVSFASPPTAQVGDFGTGRGPRRSRRTTTRVVPTPDVLQTVSTPEVTSPGTLVPEGSSMQRYW